MIGARDGVTFVAKFDMDRLNDQMKRVYSLMSDSNWRTLSEIAKITGDPESSVSARLRDLRKPKFGGLMVNRRRRFQGTYEYQVLPEGVLI
jgi:hypothetical protein